MECGNKFKLRKKGYPLGNDDWNCLCNSNVVSLIQAKNNITGIFKVNTNDKD